MDIDLNHGKLEVYERSVTGALDNHQQDNMRKRPGYLPSDGTT
ncbi:hypothetical protein [Aurantimicrobium sp.]